MCGDESWNVLYEESQKTHFTSDFELFVENEVHVIEIYVLFSRDILIKYTFDYT